MELVLGRIGSRIGALLAVCHGPTLCALEFADCSDHMMSALQAHFGEFVLVERTDPGGACSRMRAYLAGALVVRALESAANMDGGVRAGDGVASGRIGRDTPLRVVDAILTGVHEPGESHFELLRAFADDAVLDRISAALAERGYRTHEFGDSMLIERQR